MTEFSLATLNESTQIVTQLKTALAKAVGQNIVAVVIDAKLQKIGGEPTKMVSFNLENGQTASFIFRKSGDVVRFKLNGSDRPLVGDLDPKYKPSFNAAISEIADLIRGNQKKFDTAKAREKVKIPTTAKQRSAATTTSITTVKTNISQLDTQLADKAKQLENLEREYVEIQNRPK